MEAFDVPPGLEDFGAAMFQYRNHDMVPVKTNHLLGDVRLSDEEEIVLRNFAGTVGSEGVVLHWWQDAEIATVAGAANVVPTRGARLTLHYTWEHETAPTASIGVSFPDGLVEVPAASQTESVFSVDADGTVNLAGSQVRTLEAWTASVSGSGANYTIAPGAGQTVNHNTYHTPLTLTIDQPTDITLRADNNNLLGAGLAVSRQNHPYEDAGVIANTTERRLFSSHYLPVSYTHLTLPTNREV